MEWVLGNSDLILALTLDHARLSLIPIVVGFVAAVPIGWWAARAPRWGSVVISAVGVLYAIPSLALFMVLPPLLGIPVVSEANVIVALSIFAAAMMVQTVADAFSSINASSLRAATAIGYAQWGRFWSVELPLAGPVLLAGVRVVAVSTVSLVTVGVLVGVQSLGYFFTDGFQRRIVPEVITGIVMTMILAFVIDLFLVRLGALVMPWTRQQAVTKAVA